MSDPNKICKAYFTSQDMVDRFLAETIALFPELWVWQVYEETYPKYSVIWIQSTFP